MIWIFSRFSYLLVDNILIFKLTSTICIGLCGLSILIKVCSQWCQQVSHKEVGFTFIVYPYFKRCFIKSQGFEIHLVTPTSIFQFKHVSSTLESNIKMCIVYLLLEYHYSFLIEFHIHILLQLLLHHLSFSLMKKVYLYE